MDVNVWWLIGCLVLIAMREVASACTRKRLREAREVLKDLAAVLIEPLDNELYQLLKFARKMGYREISVWAFRGELANTHILKAILKLRPYTSYGVWEKIRGVIRRVTRKFGFAWVEEVDKRGARFIFMDQKR